MGELRDDGGEETSPGDAGGPNAEFERLFTMHHRAVLAYALRRLESRDAAEDIAAQTFAIAWRRRGDVPEDPLPWLYGVARRVIANERRADERRVRLYRRLSSLPEERDNDPGETPTFRASATRALERLSEREREALRLTAWEGLDHARAALAAGCSRGAFAVRVHRARRKLAKELAGAGHENELDPAPAAAGTD